MNTTRLLLISVFVLVWSTVQAAGPSDCMQSVLPNVVVLACTELLASEPNNAVAHFKRAKANLDGRTKIEDVDSAIADLTKAIEINPSYAEAYNQRGIGYGHIMDFPRAMADETKAIELDPSLARAHRVRGALLSKERDHDRALADLSKAIELDPTFAVTYFERALAYAAKGDTGAAIEDLETALTRGLFGMMRRLTPDNLEQIGPLLTKAIERNGEDAVAYAGRGGIHRVRGNLEQAIAEYSRAIEHDRRLVEAYIGRGVSYFRLRADDPRALADLNKAIELDPKHPGAYLLRGLFHIGGVFQTSGRRRTEALADFTKAVEVDPDFGPAYANRALLLRSSSGEKTAAQADIFRAAQLDSMLVSKMQPWPSFLGNVNMGGLPVPR